MRNMESNSSFRVSWLRDELAQRNEQRLVCAAEEGFTLIELMVVLLILAILLAIAIPTFLGVKGGSQDRAAQSNLTNALIVGKTISAKAGGTYPTPVTSLSASFASSEPGLTFSTTSVAVTGNISIAVSSSGQTIALVTYSQNKKCWVVEDNESALGTDIGISNYNAARGTSYGEYPYVAATSCNAQTLPASGLTWSQSGYPNL